MGRRDRREQARRDARILSRIPKSLRPVVGSVVLVGAVRTVDAIWTRISGRRPPSRDPEATPQEDAAPHVVRDRLVYSLVLDGVLRLARRAGLRDTKDT